MTPSRSLDQWLLDIDHRHVRDVDLGLARIGAVARTLGIDRPARHVITVAGTNGKGSTVAFIEAIARAAGWRVGAYTSPHLLAFNERVRIDGSDADDASLVAAFEAVEQARLRTPASGGADGNEGIAGSDGNVELTYFEYATLAALWMFQRAGLDLAILEVGLGGRLDATNLVDADVAVVTTVDLDHQDWLGDDRESIGREKAGIARAWKPLVLGDDDPPSSVLGHAYAIGASAIRANCDFFFAADDVVGLDRARLDDTHALDAHADHAHADDAQTDDTQSGSAVHAPTWRWHEVGFELRLPMPALTAPVQLRNAATAIAAIRALGVPLAKAAYAHGVANAHVTARLQAFDRDGTTVIVDVAHNPQAARALADALRAQPVRGRTSAVFAALTDKDVAGIVAALADVVDAWHLAGLPDAGARGSTAANLAARLAGSAARDARQHVDVDAALAAVMAAPAGDRTVRLDAATGDRIIVFGSFHTAGAALRWLNPAG